MNSKMLFIAIGAVVVIALAGFLLTKNSTSNNAGVTPTPTSAMLMDDTPTASQSQEMTTDTGTPAAGTDTTDKKVVKEITVTGSNFKFSPATLTVNKGDVVNLTFKNSGGMHDFVIDELGVKTKVIPDGGEVTVQFTASKVGTFDYYCSVGNHRAMGMQGTITVK